MKIQCVLLLLLFINLSFAQSGGRKRENKNEHTIKVLKRQGSPWGYRPTKPGPIQKKEQKWLFRRSITKGERARHKLLNKQNRLRAKRRIRGNEVFYKRKY